MDEPLLSNVVKHTPAGDKILQPYVLLIMNCAKYGYKRERQCKTWLRDLPSWLVYYHVIGVPTQPTEYIFNNDEHILYVRAPDDYNGLPQKVIAAYAAIAAVYKFDYIFKTDDDQTAIQPATKLFGTIRTCLEIMAARPHYGGHIVDVKEDHISGYYRLHPELPRNVLVKRGRYCNGRFYVLSDVAVADLISKRRAFAAEYFEDYAVGRLLDPEIREPIFKIDTGKNFRDDV